MFSDETPLKIATAFQQVVKTVSNRPRTSTGVLIVIILCVWLGYNGWRSYKQDELIYKELASHVAKERERYPEPEDMQAMLVESQNNNIRINAVLQRIVKEGADRAYLMKFHNGTRDINGMHFMYVSTTNEETAAGIANVMPHVQDVTTSMFETDWIAKFLQRECVDIRVKELPENTAMHGTMDKIGVAQMHICPINDIQNGHLMGLIGASWVKNEPDRKLEDRTEAALTGSTIALASLLMPEK